jgi:hypothetical protein
VVGIFAGRWNLFRLLDYRPPDDGFFCSAFLFDRLYLMCACGKAFMTPSHGLVGAYCPDCRGPLVDLKGRTYDLRRGYLRVAAVQVELWKKAGYPVRTNDAH